MFFKYYSNYLKEQHLSTTYLLQIYMYYITIYLPKHVVARQSVTLTTDNLTFIYMYIYIIYTRYYFFFFQLLFPIFICLQIDCIEEAILLYTTYSNIHVYNIHLPIHVVARHKCALTTNILACK